MHHPLARTEQIISETVAGEGPETAQEMEERIFEDLRSVLVKAGCSEEWIATCAAQTCRYLAMRASRLPRDG